MGNRRIIHPVTGHIKARLLGLPVLFVLSAALGGCFEMPAPAQTSAAKFVRQTRVEQVASPADTTDGNPALPEDDGARGKVTASLGILTNLMISEGESDTIMYFFPMEAAWTGFLGERYDLAISANNFGLLGLEGNAALVSNQSIRLGLMHGLSVGGSSYIEEPGDGFIGIGAQGGLFIQTNSSPRGNFFAAARYAYTNFFETEDFDDGLSFHHAIFSIGGAANSGRLQIIPELIIDVAPYTEGDFVNMMIIPTITVSANY